jgi:hypothetical protein
MLTHSIITAIFHPGRAQSLYGRILLDWGSIAAYGAGVLLVALYRRHEGNRQFFTEALLQQNNRQPGRPEAAGQHKAVPKFRTSGNAVMAMTALSILAITSLLVLTLKLHNS